MNEPKKDLKTDTKGEVMYPFVLIIALVMVLGFILSGIAQYAESGDLTQLDYLELDAPFGLYNYTTIDADAGDDRYVDFGPIQGYQVSDDDVLDYVPYPTDADPFTFYDADDEDTKYIHIIRDNRDYDPDSADMFEMYQDFIVVRRDPANFFKFSDEWQNAVIPFTAIAGGFFNSTNVSVTEFQLGDSQDSLFVNATDGGEANFTAALWGNDFIIYYGWSLFRLEEVDFWNAISMVLYAEIPGVHPMVNWIFHAFVIGTMVYVVFRMAVMMTPFLGG